MSSVILAYEWPRNADTMSIELVPSAKWINTRLREGTVYLFFSACAGPDLRTRTFEMFPSGKSIPAYSLYCGTVIKNGEWVHIVEVMP